MPKSVMKFCDKCGRQTEHLIGPGGDFGCMDEGYPREHTNMDNLPDIFRGRTYTWDLPLFKELGLQPFEKALHGEQFEVGRVRLDAGEITVSVTCVPEQFWAFDIFPADGDGHPIHLITGSGSLGQYWPTVLLFLKGMIAVHVIETEQ